MTTLTTPLDLSPEQNLSRYLQKIQTYPMLTVENERDYAERWRDHQDQLAMHAMVNSHLRLVAKIAMKFRGYGLPISDLISEGNVGMMQAINRFDPEKGFRLSTYAMWWIRASIQEYILHTWSLVKIGTTAAQKKLFFNLRKLKAKLKTFDEGDLAPEFVTKIAEHLDVPEKDVVSMNRRMSGGDQSLNVPVYDDGGGERQDWLVDDSLNQEEIVGKQEEKSSRHALLMNALNGLNDRERGIVVERRLSETPKTLQDLSEEYGISRERVRQIEVCAFEKVQKSVRNAVVDQNVMH